MNRASRVDSARVTSCGGVDVMSMAIDQFRFILEGPQPAPSARLQEYGIGPTAENDLSRRHGETVQG